MISMSRPRTESQALKGLPGRQRWRLGLAEEDAGEGSWKYYINVCILDITVPSAP